MGDPRNRLGHLSGFSHFSLITCWQSSLIQEIQRVDLAGIRSKLIAIVEQINDS